MQVHFESLRLPLAAFSGVFLISLHGVIHIIRLYFTTSMPRVTAEIREAYGQVFESLFFLTILSGAWALFQSLYALWGKVFDSISLILVMLFIFSTGTMIYTWCLWRIMDVPSL